MRHFARHGHQGRSPSYDQVKSVTHRTKIKQFGQLKMPPPPLFASEKRRVRGWQMLHLMQISHENESEHDIDIEVVGVGLASEDWDFRSFAAGTGPNPADPAEVLLFGGWRCSGVLSFCFSGGEGGEGGGGTGLGGRMMVGLGEGKCGGEDVGGVEGWRGCW